MESLLKHLVNMTGHRDHTMLDLSCLAAVQELAGAIRTRVLTLTSSHGEMFVRARAIVYPGSSPKIQEQVDSKDQGDPISKFPELSECVSCHGLSALARSDDGSFTLWFPIWFDERADTCLEIVHTAPYNADILNDISSVIGVYRNFLSLLDYSERDSLTGLLNRKTFDEEFAKMLHAHSEQSEGAPVSVERRATLGTDSQWLAVVDIDHFKLVNDKFGHLYGDEVLILIANLMHSSFRTTDRIFRFGGEEFVVLLRSTSAVNAKMVIDRFRTKVEGHLFPQVGHVTVSVGFVSISARESPVIILGRADQALYYAKNHGRNQACDYEKLVADGLLQAVASNDTAEFF
jgi:diguanylate cyclase (GGDEF)-like protein